MTLNLTELRDEPLGKHPSQAYLYVCRALHEAEQDVVAADDESSFTFDVDGLSDEALDPQPRCVVQCSAVALHTSSAVTELDAADAAAA